MYVCMFVYELQPYRKWKFSDIVTDIESEPHTDVLYTEDCMRWDMQLYLKCAEKKTV